MTSLIHGAFESLPPLQASIVQIEKAQESKLGMVHQPTGPRIFAVSRPGCSHEMGILKGIAAHLPRLALEGKALTIQDYFDRFLSNEIQIFFTLYNPMAIKEKQHTILTNAFKSGHVQTAITMLQAYPTDRLQSAISELSTMFNAIFKKYSQSAELIIALMEAFTKIQSDKYILPIFQRHIIMPLHVSQFALEEFFKQGAEEQEAEESEDDSQTPQPPIAPNPFIVRLFFIAMIKSPPLARVLLENDTFRLLLKYSISQEYSAMIDKFMEYQIRPYLRVSCYSMFMTASGPMPLKEIMQSLGILPAEEVPSAGNTATGTAGSAMPQRPTESLGYSAAGAGAAGSVMPQRPTESLGYSAAAAGTAGSAMPQRPTESLASLQQRFLDTTQNISTNSGSSAMFARTVQAKFTSFVGTTMTHQERLSALKTTIQPFENPSAFRDMFRKARHCRLVSVYKTLEVNDATSLQRALEFLAADKSTKEYLVAAKPTL
jgi:hypothetical protein